MLPSTVILLKSTFVRAGGRFLAIAALFGSVSWAAEPVAQPVCPGLLPPVGARFVSADPARVEVVNAALDQLQAAFASLRQPARLAVCLSPELQEQEGLALHGFIALPLYASPRALWQNRAALYHEYGHHLFYLNLGRYAETFDIAPDFFEQMNGAMLELSALANKKLNFPEDSPEWRELDERQKVHRDKVALGHFGLVFAQLAAGDVNEVMSDLVAVLMMRDPSAIAKVLRELDRKPHPERDFLSVAVTSDQRKDLHGRLWRVRQAIGRRYLLNPDWSRPAEIYAQVLAAFGRGIERIMKEKGWSVPLNKRVAIFVEEINR